jgi:hypothetical protein
VTRTGWTLCVGCVLWLAACDDDAIETEVVVLVDAEEGVRMDAHLLRVDVERLSETGAKSEPGPTQAVQDWPYKLALHPRGNDADRSWRVTARAFSTADDGELVLIAAARVQSSFVAGERRWVRLLLEDACRSEPLCPEDNETCHVGAERRENDDPCVSAELDARDFATRQGDAPDVGDLIDRRDERADGGAPDGGDGGGAGEGAAGSPPEGGSGGSNAGRGGGGEGGGGGSTPTCEPEDVECAAKLTALAVAGAELDFDPDVTEYALTVPIASAQVEITASAPANAEIAIDGDDAQAGEPWTSQELTVGDSATITIVVTAGERSTEYELRVTRGAQEAYVKAHNTSADAMFGTAVATSGDRVVVGAPSAGGGVVEVFVREDDGWRAEGNALTATNGASGDEFGSSVAIDGETIVVGAPSEDGGADDSGAAYVFTFDGQLWQQRAYLKAGAIDARDYFGWSVAIADRTIVVGSLSDDGPGNAASGTGAAHVFEGDGDTWSATAYLWADAQADGGEQFGGSVAISADAAVIAAGANGDDGSDGAVYVFRRSGATWVREDRLLPLAPGLVEGLGQRVALSGDVLVAGASTLAASTPSAAYVFEHGAGGWSAGTALLATNAATSDRFGLSVAVSGDVVVVGAPLDDHSQGGIHPPDAAVDDAFPSSGAAYVFARDADTWQEVAQLKANNAEAMDQFGFAVAVADGVIAVGANQESSQRTGVLPGSPENDDDVEPNSGAVYLFR